MQTFSGFRSLSPSYAVLVQCGIFCLSHLPFGDACIFPLSLSYDPLPPQNLASHNLVSRRQSVVVLTVEMVYYKHYHEQHGEVPKDLLRRFSILKKCRNKFDCLVNEMLFIRDLKPTRNVQSDSIRAKGFILISFKHCLLISCFTFPQTL